MTAILKRTCLNGKMRIFHMQKHQAMHFTLD